MSKYLVEETLYPIICDIFSSNEWIHNKNFSKKIRTRPDYRLEENKIIIEFNGYYHYSQSKIIIDDYKKYSIYEQFGYKVIKIPYFVQMSSNIIKLLFNKEYKYNQQYPHGFIDSKCVLPSDFCSLGICRFEQDLEFFSCIKTDIVDSIKQKIIELDNVELVLPENLKYLLNDINYEI